jgi:hypothetical protein
LIVQIWPHTRQEKVSLWFSTLATPNHSIFGDSHFGQGGGLGGHMNRSYDGDTAFVTRKSDQAAGLAMQRIFGADKDCAQRRLLWSSPVMARVYGDPI